MGFLWTKQAAILDNIANAETPNYKEKVVTFEESLRSKIETAARGTTPRKLVRQVLEKQGRRVPEDCSLVCFDYSNEDWEAEGVTCSVHQGFRIGREVASRLMRMIRNRDCDDINYTYVLAPEIYLGRTVGPARN